MKNTVTIIESGMSFGEFDPERIFHIEDSNLYRKLGTSIRTTEFLYLDYRNYLQLVEAKTSCPNVNNREENREKKEKYEQYYTEITEKFMDTLNILASFLLGRIETREYIDESSGKRILNLTSLKGIRIRFVLVIKNAEESWLTGVRTELERRLLSTRKIWDADVMVLNEDFALRKNLIAVNQNKGEKNT